LQSSDPLRPLLSLAQLVFLHTVAVAEFGGSEGIRDRGLLESALARPLSGFGAVSSYTTPFSRAAALMEGLIQNHDFVDGNKRTAVMAAAFWLEKDGYILTASQDLLVETALAVASHRLSLDDLASRLEENAAYVQEA